MQLFLEYRHGGSEPADVTFNLKDFKAMLSLCEGLNANVSVSFEAPGSPVVVKPHVARQQVRSPALTDCITVWCEYKSFEATGAGSVRHQLIRW